MQGTVKYPESTMDTNFRFKFCNDGSPFISSFVVMFFVVLFPHDTWLSLSCSEQCVCNQISGKLLVNCEKHVNGSITAIEVPAGIHAVDVFLGPRYEACSNVDNLFNDTSWESVEDFGLYPTWQATLRINGKTFQHLTNVRRATIAHVNPPFWEQNALQHFNKLEELNVSNSNDLRFDDAADLLQHIYHTPLVHLNLSMTNNWRGSMAGAFVSLKFLQTLMEFSLKVLDISRTGILLINKAYVHVARDYGNRSIFHSLEVLYLSDVYITTYGGDSSWKSIEVFGDVPSLKKLVSRQIRMSRYMLESNKSCQEESRLKSCDGNILSIPENLTEIIIEDNTFIPPCFLHYPCPAWSPYNSIEMISLKNTGIERFELELFRMFIKLRELDVRNNNITYFIPTVFKNLEHLRVVKLGGNQIGTSPNFPLVEIFSYTENLEFIDISRNHLKSVPSDMFTNNAQLRVIDLSSNELGEFTLKIHHMINLELLDLKNNHIKFIADNSLKDIHALLFLERNRSFVNLLRNSFICSCEHLEFIGQLKNIKGALVDPETYECDMNSEHRKLLEVHQDDIQFLCYALLLKISLSCAGVVLVGIIVGVVCYKKRLLFLKLKVKFRFWRYRNKRVDATDRVFVAYCAKDKDFALKLFNKLNPGLQQLIQTEGDVLYINDKHFKVPGYIDEEIVRGIRSCRCTIPIISENFVKSTWANLETSFTWAEKKPILPVFLDKMKQRDLPGVLGYYYDKKTRLLYTGDAAKDEMFWQTLLVGIADVLNKRRELDVLTRCRDTDAVVPTDSGKN